MINISKLNHLDIGREVSYKRRGNKNREQFGTITGFNNKEVFVLFPTTPDKIPGESCPPQDLTFTQEAIEYPDLIDLELEGLEHGRYKLDIKNRKVKSMVSKGNLHESKTGNVSLVFNVDTIIKLMKNKITK